MAVINFIRVVAGCRSFCLAPPVAGRIQTTTVFIIVYALGITNEGVANDNGVAVILYIDSPVQAIGNGVASNLAPVVHPINLIAGLGSVALA